MKKRVIVSFTTEADSDALAMLELNKVLMALPENDFLKFNFHTVKDIEENN